MDAHCHVRQRAAPPGVNDITSSVYLLLEYSWPGLMACFTVGAHIVLHGREAWGWAGGKGGINVILMPQNVYFMEIDQLVVSPFRCDFDDTAQYRVSAMNSQGELSAFASVVVKSRSHQPLNPFTHGHENKCKTVV